MRRLATAIAIAALVLPAGPGSAELYRWVDEKGGVHLTENLWEVPAGPADRGGPRRRWSASGRPPQWNRLEVPPPASIARPRSRPGPAGALGPGAGARAPPAHPAGGPRDPSGRAGRRPAGAVHRRHRRIAEHHSELGRRAAGSRDRRGHARDRHAGGGRAADARARDHRGPRPGGHGRGPGRGARGGRHHERGPAGHAVSSTTSACRSIPRRA